MLHRHVRSGPAARTGFRFRALVLCAAFALGGCVTVNPKPSPPSLRAAEAAKDAGTVMQPADYTFDMAMAYIDVARTRMRGYADQPTQIRNLAGVGAVGAAVGAAASALFDAHEDYILGFGLAGGSLLGAANLYGNPAFEQIYEQGDAALSCIQTRVLAPLNTGHRIKSAGADLAGGIATLRNTMDPVQTARLKTARSLAALATFKKELAAEAARLTTAKAASDAALSEASGAVAARAADLSALLPPDQREDDPAGLVQRARTHAQNLRTSAEKKIAEANERATELRVLEEEEVRQQTVLSTAAEGSAEARGAQEAIADLQPKIEAARKASQQADAAANAAKAARDASNDGAQAIDAAANALEMAIAGRGTAEGTAAATDGERAAVAAYRAYATDLEAAQNALAQNYAQLLDEAGTAITEANALRRAVARVENAESDVASQVVAAVDRVFVQVRNKIMDADPGTQGVANTVALFRGFGGLGEIAPPDRLKAGEELQLAEPAAAPSDPNAVGDKEAVLALAPEDRDSRLTLNQRRVELGVADLSDLQVSVEQQKALIDAAETLNQSTIDAALRAEGASDFDPAVDLTPCNVEGATIPAFELVNRPDAPPPGDGEEAPQTPAENRFQITPGEAASVFTLSVRGGQMNYGYRILGQTPAGMSVTYGGGASFAVTIPAKPAEGALPDVTLELFDSRGQSIVVVLDLSPEQETQQQANAGGEGAPPAPAPAGAVLQLSAADLTLQPTDDAPAAASVEITGGQPPFTLSHAPTGQGITTAGGGDARVFHVVAAAGAQTDGAVTVTVTDAAGATIDLPVTAAAPQ
ncbi:MAG: hypothetical protein NXI21_14435 [Alphaproteobacteria bacterium]|nr:hypothetical protein [Alphaproteobacteria bacterium]